MQVTKERLIQELDEQLSYLSNTKIPGMERADIKQELILMVLKDYPGHEDIDMFSKGWWFKRLKWYLLNLIEKERKEPVNKAFRFERLQNDGK